ncbi:outer membrane protein OmpV [Shewanella waksmanii]|uniref:outer membrane protein OmpV n=1 Tax=Shewanella waksmanii TaxID=213783 RepID=UPI00048C3053|nr:MipA/OmpV family protein [Shewanella waksmanii]
MKKIYLVISTLLLANSALAADNTYIRNGNIYSHQGQFFAGAGGATGSEFYKGQDHKTGVYFNGGYHGEDFNADLAGINYRFFGDNNSGINFSAFVVANPGFDASDADILKGMKDRKISGDLGLNADIHLGRGTLSTKFQHDVTGVYDGYQADITYYHPMKLGFADFVPFAGVHYYSEKYINYYAGVSKSDATQDRAEYKGDAAFSYHAGYALVIPITDNLDITQSSAHSHLSEELADSPLISSNNQWVTTLGVTYSF